MSWADLIREDDVSESLRIPGYSFVVKDVPLRLFKAEPAIRPGEERDSGKTVFAVMGDSHIYITPDQAIAMGIALIKAAAQERRR